MGPDVLHLAALGQGHVQQPVIHMAAVLHPLHDHFLIGLVGTEAHDFPGDIHRVQMVAYLLLHPGVHRRIVIAPEVHRIGLFQYNDFCPFFGGRDGGAHAAHACPHHYHIRSFRSRNFPVRNGLGRFHKIGLGIGTDDIALLIGLMLAPLAAAGQEGRCHHSCQGRSSAFEKTAAAQVNAFHNAPSPARGSGTFCHSAGN